MHLSYAQRVQKVQNGWCRSLNMCFGCLFYSPVRAFGAIYRLSGSSMLNQFTYNFHSRKGIMIWYYWSAWSEGKHKRNVHSKNKRYNRLASPCTNRLQEGPDCAGSKFQYAPIADTAIRDLTGSGLLLVVFFYKILKRRSENQIAGIPCNRTLVLSP